MTLEALPEPHRGGGAEKIAAVGRNHDRELATWRGIGEPDPMGAASIRKDEVAAVGQLAVGNDSADHGGIDRPGVLKVSGSGG